MTAEEALDLAVREKANAERILEDDLNSGKIIDIIAGYMGEIPSNENFPDLSVHLAHEQENSTYAKDVLERVSAHKHINVEVIVYYSIGGLGRRIVKR